MCCKKYFLISTNYGSKEATNKFEYELNVGSSKSVIIYPLIKITWNTKNKK